MFWKLNKLGLTEHQIPKQRSWLVIKHSLDIFSHVRSANRCFEGVTHSSCFVNKKLERECLSLFALCLLRKEGRPAKGYVQIFLKGGPTVSRKTKRYLLLAWSPCLLLLPWILLGYVRSLLFTDLNPKCHFVIMQKGYKYIKPWKAYRVWADV